MSKQNLLTMETYLLISILIAITLLICSFIFGLWTGSHRMLPPSLLKMWSVYFWIIFSLIFLLSVFFAISTDEKTNWEIGFFLKIITIFSITSILCVTVYTIGNMVTKARIKARRRLYNNQVIKVSRFSFYITTLLVQGEFFLTKILKSVN